MLFQTSATHKQQQGIVIVIALFIVALVATMAYVMMSRLERDTLRTMMLVRNTQAEYYAQGAALWAMDELRHDWDNRAGNKLIDKTPIHTPQVKENGYQIVSTIYDMQSRFNLNNLTMSDAQSAFKRLLQIVITQITEQETNQLILAISEQVARKPMLSASELRLIKGITTESFLALKPYVTALPQGVLINTQNALEPVITSIGSTGVNSITTISNYFLVETNVTIEKQHVVLYTLLERMINSQKASVNIIWQSKGVW